MAQVILSSVGAAIGGPLGAVAGAALQLSGTETLLGAGRTVAAWEWVLVSGGGAVAAFDSLFVAFL